MQCSDYEQQRKTLNLNKNANMHAFRDSKLLRKYFQLLKSLFRIKMNMPWNEAHFYPLLHWQAHAKVWHTYDAQWRNKQKGRQILDIEMSFYPVKAQRSKQVQAFLPF